MPRSAGRIQPSTNSAIPSAPAAFAAAVRALRTEESRADFYERIRGACPCYASLIRNGPPSPAARTTAARLYEQRLLEFTRTPSVRREFGLDLSFAHSYAWSDLTHLRSAPFAARLVEWTRGSDSFIARHAARHLAWMGRRRDLPLLLRLLSSGKAKFVEAVADGARMASYHKHAEPGFVAAISGALAPIITGKQRLAGVGGGLFSSLTEAFTAVIEFLIQADRTAAMSLLGSERVLSPRNPALGSALLHLELQSEEQPNLVRRTVDADAVWSVFEYWRGSRRNKPDRSTILGRSLVIGALADPARALREAKALGAAAKQDRALMQHVSAALRTCRNTPDAALLLNRHRAGKLRITGDAAAVMAALELATEVLGDGLELYFHNLGNSWPAARRGLDLIGQPRAAKALAAAARIAFGTARVDTPAAARTAFNNLTPARQVALAKACAAYEKVGDGIYAAAERYIGRNPPKFHP